MSENKEAASTTGAGAKGQGLNIHQKLAAMKANLVVEKTGYDEGNDYYYFKADDVARAAHKIMTEFNVVHRTTIDSYDIDNHWDKQGRNRPRVTAVCTVAFIDADGNGHMDTQVIATGSDIGGDKATRKLMVQAFKEAAIDVFGITEGMQGMDSDTYAQAEADLPAGDDPEVSSNVEPTSKELGEQLQALIQDPEVPHATTDLAISLGREVAKEILGAVPSDRVWRKDARVLGPLITRIKNGDIPADPGPEEKSE